MVTWPPGIPGLSSFQQKKITLLNIVKLFVSRLLHCHFLSLLCYWYVTTADYIIKGALVYHKNMQHTHTCMHTFTHTHARAHTCTHTRAHVHTHTCTHTHTHTRTHTYTHTQYTTHAHTHIHTLCYTTILIT